MRQTQFPNLREDYTSPLVPSIRVGFAGRDHDSQVAINVVAYLRYAVVFEKKERWTETILSSLVQKKKKNEDTVARFFRLGKSLSLVRFFEDPVFLLGTCVCAFESCNRQQPQ